MHKAHRKCPVKTACYRRKPINTNRSGGIQQCPSQKAAYKETVVSWIYLLIAIVAEVIATSALKPADGFTKPLPTAIVFVGYGTAFLFLSLTLRTIPIGVTYAIWAGLGIALITAIGWLVFGERLDPFALLGIGLIVAGVLVINIFSKAAAH
jgi:multidrug transporter EmrE-like cation transporter